MSGQHSQWKCTKCGERASSKCVASRSVFPENQIASAISHSLMVSTETGRSGETMTGRKATEHFLNIKYLEVVYEEEEQEIEDLREHLLEKLLNVLRKNDEETLRIAICRHEWEIQHGKCIFGCHEATRDKLEVIEGGAE